MHIKVCTGHQSVHCDKYYYINRHEKVKANGSTFLWCGDCCGSIFWLYSKAIDL